MKYILDNLPKQPVYYREIPACVASAAHKQVTRHSYAHLDFLWDYTANTEFYGKLVELLASYPPTKRTATVLQLK